MANSSFRIDISQIDKLHEAMKNYQGNTEQDINDILHNEASPLIQDAIKRLIPVSGVKWKGKRPGAKSGKSLTDMKSNLAITVKTTKNYQYLYFPDDGSSTKRHHGNQQFFKKGGESQQEEIVNRCIKRLVEGFDNAMN